MNNIIDFLLYIVPGFLTIQIYEKFYPDRDKNVFICTGWSVIYSLFILAIAYFLISIFGWGTELTTKPSSENGSFFLFLAFLLVISIALAAIKLIARVLAFELSKKFEKFRFLAPNSKSVWEKLNATENDFYALVFLKNDAIYIGWISTYQNDPNYSSFDFLLKDAKRVDEKLNEIYQVKGIGVYLNTKDVSRMELLDPQ